VPLIERNVCAQYHIASDSAAVMFDSSLSHLKQPLYRPWRSVHVRRAWGRAVTFACCAPIRFSLSHPHQGIASGPLVGGVVGRDRLAYDIWGHTVNCAARMEQFGYWGHIQCDDATANLLRGWGHLTLHDNGRPFIKGLGHLQTWILTCPALYSGGAPLPPSAMLASSIRASVRVPPIPPPPRRSSDDAAGLGSTTDHASRTGPIAAAATASAAAAAGGTPSGDDEATSTSSSSSSSSFERPDVPAHPAAGAATAAVATATATGGASSSSATHPSTSTGTSTTGTPAALPPTTGVAVPATCSGACLTHGGGGGGSAAAGTAGDLSISMAHTLSLTELPPLAPSTVPVGSPHPQTSFGSTSPPTSPYAAAPAVLHAYPATQPAALRGGTGTRAGDEAADSLSVSSASESASTSDDESGTHASSCTTCAARRGAMATTGDRAGVTATAAACATTVNATTKATAASLGKEGATSAERSTAAPYISVVAQQPKATGCVGAAVPSGAGPLAPASPPLETSSGRTPVIGVQQTMPVF